MDTPGMCHVCICSRTKASTRSACPQHGAANTNRDVEITTENFFIDNSGRGVGRAGKTYSRLAAKRKRCSVLSDDVHENRRQYQQTNPDDQQVDDSEFDRDLKLPTDAVDVNMQDR